jgi:hypothetical protein
MLNRGSGYASDPIITVNATGFSNQTIVYCLLLWLWPGFAFAVDVTPFSSSLQQVRAT